MGLNIVVTGLNIAAEHWEAMGDLILGAIWTIQNQAGIEMTREGVIRIARYGAVDTGATLRSIHHVMSTTQDSVTVSVGPTTFYAPFIEYGLGSHVGYGPRPFMMDAMFAIVPAWIRAFASLAVLAKVGAKTKITPGPYKTPMDNFLAQFRRRLYSIEKALGDIAPLGMVGFRIPGTTTFRETLLGGARAIGDVQAVVGRAVGARVTRRLTGKATGRLIGVGSRSVFANQQISAGPISGGQRIYNRVAGRAVTKYIDQSSTFGGG
jgi:hypothetical protein